MASTNSNNDRKTRYIFEYTFTGNNATAIKKIKELENQWRASSNNMDAQLDIVMKKQERKTRSQSLKTKKNTVDIFQAPFVKPFSKDIGAGSEFDDFMLKQQQLRGVTTGLRHEIGKIRNTLLLVAFATGSVVSAFKNWFDSTLKNESALVGLRSVAISTGISFEKLREISTDLEQKGFLSLTGSAAAQKNLAASNLTLQETKSVMTALVDAAAFNRQGQLSVEEAVVGATQGIKNQNCEIWSTLVYDPVRGERRTIEEWHDDGIVPCVLSLNRQTGEMEVIQAEYLHYNGENEVYEIELENGVIRTVTGNHSFLTQNGFKFADELIDNQDLLYYVDEDSIESSLREIRQQIIGDLCQTNQIVSDVENLSLQMLLEELGVKNSSVKDAGLKKSMKSTDSIIQSLIHGLKLNVKSVEQVSSLLKNVSKKDLEIFVQVLAGRKITDYGTLEKIVAGFLVGLLSNVKSVEKKKNFLQEKFKEVVDSVLENVEETGGLQFNKEKMLQTGKAEFQRTVIKSDKGENINNGNNKYYSAIGYNVVNVMSFAQVIITRIIYTLKPDILNGNLNQIMVSPYVQDVIEKFTQEMTIHLKNSSICSPMLVKIVRISSKGISKTYELSIPKNFNYVGEFVIESNSIMIDNAGITKNVSVMYREYALTVGKTAGMLTEQEKRQAIVNGIMMEAALFAGNAEKSLNTYQGRITKFQTSMIVISRDLGSIIAGDIVDGLQNVVDSYTNITKQDIFKSIIKSIANYFTSSVSLVTKFIDHTISSIKAFDSIISSVSGLIAKNEAGEGFLSLNSILDSNIIKVGLFSTAILKLNSYLITTVDKLRAGAFTQFSSQVQTNLLKQAAYTKIFPLSGLPTQQEKLASQFGAINIFGTKASRESAKRDLRDMASQQAIINAEMNAQIKSGNAEKFIAKDVTSRLNILEKTGLSTKKDLLQFELTLNEARLAGYNIVRNTEDIKVGKNIIGRKGELSATTKPINELGQKQSILIFNNKEQIAGLSESSMQYQTVVGRILQTWKAVGIAGGNALMQIKLAFINATQSGTVFQLKLVGIKTAMVALGTAVKVTVTAVIGAISTVLFWVTSIMLVIDLISSLFKKTEDKSQEYIRTIKIEQDAISKLTDQHYRLMNSLDSINQSFSLISNIQEYNNQLKQTEKTTKSIKDLSRTELINFDKLANIKSIDSNSDKRRNGLTAELKLMIELINELQPQVDKLKKSQKEILDQKTIELNIKSDKIELLKDKLENIKTTITNISLQDKSIKFKLLGEDRIKLFKKEQIDLENQIKKLSPEYVNLSRRIRETFENGKSNEIILNYETLRTVIKDTRIELEKLKEDQPSEFKLNIDNSIAIMTKHFNQIKEITKETEKLSGTIPVKKESVVSLSNYDKILTKLGNTIYSSRTSLQYYASRIEETNKKLDVLKKKLIFGKPINEDELKSATDDLEEFKTKYNAIFQELTDATDKFNQAYEGAIDKITKAASQGGGLFGQLAGKFSSLKDDLTYALGNQQYLISIKINNPELAKDLKLASEQFDAFQLLQASAYNNFYRDIEKIVQDGEKKITDLRNQYSELQLKGIRDSVFKQLVEFVRSINNEKSKIEQEIQSLISEKTLGNLQLEFVKVVSKLGESLAGSFLTKGVQNFNSSFDLMKKTSIDSLSDILMATQEFRTKYEEALAPQPSGNPQRFGETEIERRVPQDPNKVIELLSQKDSKIKKISEIYSEFNNAYKEVINRIYDIDKILEKSKNKTTGQLEFDDTGILNFSKALSKLNGAYTILNNVEFKNKMPEGLKEVTDKVSDQFQSVLDKVNQYIGNIQTATGEIQQGTSISLVSKESLTELDAASKKIESSYSDTIAANEKLKTGLEISKNEGITKIIEEYTNMDAAQLESSKTTQNLTNVLKNYSDLSAVTRNNLLLESDAQLEWAQKKELVFKNFDLLSLKLTNLRNTETDSSIIDDLDAQLELIKRSIPQIEEFFDNLKTIEKQTRADNIFKTIAEDIAIAKNELGNFYSALEKNIVTDLFDLSGKLDNSLKLFAERLSSLPDLFDSKIYIPEDKLFNFDIFAETSLSNIDNFNKEILSKRIKLTSDLNNNFIDPTLFGSGLDVYLNSALIDIDNFNKEIITKRVELTNDLNNQAPVGFFDLNNLLGVDTASLNKISNYYNSARTLVTEHFNKLKDQIESLKTETIFNLNLGLIFPEDAKANLAQLDGQLAILNSELEKTQLNINQVEFTEKFAIWQANVKEFVNNFVDSFYKLGRSIGDAFVQIKESQLQVADSIKEVEAAYSRGEITLGTKLDRIRQLHDYNAALIDKVWTDLGKSIIQSVLDTTAEMFKQLAIQRFVAASMSNLQKSGAEGASGVNAIGGSISALSGILAAIPGALPFAGIAAGIGLLSGLLSSSQEPKAPDFQAQEQNQLSKFGGTIKAEEVKITIQPTFIIEGNQVFIGSGSVVEFIEESQQLMKEGIQQAIDNKEFNFDNIRSIN